MVATGVSVPCNLGKGWNQSMAVGVSIMHGRPVVCRLQKECSAMGELNEKAKGAANQIAGKAKQVVADATDNPKLKVEGDLQQAKGKLQNAAGTVMGKLGDKI
jgi:uncharacterized protein YjbJ (UPF0337 family)